VKNLGLRFAFEWRRELKRDEVFRVASMEAEVEVVEVRDLQGTSAEGKRPLAGLGPRLAVRVVAVGAEAAPEKQMVLPSPSSVWHSMVQSFPPH
jgi:hypothetical protein